MLKSKVSLMRDRRHPNLQVRSSPGSLLTNIGKLSSCAGWVEYPPFHGI